MNKPFPAPRPPFLVEKKNERRPFKPRAWNHQDELKGLIGKTIELHYMDDAMSVGKLLNADQFTIQIQREGDQSPLTVFKSSLASFRERK